MPPANTSSATARRIIDNGKPNRWNSLRRYEGEGTCSLSLNLHSGISLVMSMQSSVRGHFYILCANLSTRWSYVYLPISISMFLCYPSECGNFFGLCWLCMLLVASCMYSARLGYSLFFYPWDIYMLLLLAAKCKFWLLRDFPFRILVCAYF